MRGRYKALIIIIALIVIGYYAIPFVQACYLGHSVILDYRIYSVKNPTYSEMNAFITSDNTDSNTYRFPDYVCENFAQDTRNNAIRSGIRCGIVTIEFYGGTEVTIKGVTYTNGHEIICFETMDRGLIFIEPQHDQEVVLSKGVSFSTVNGFEPLANDVIDDYYVKWW